MLINANTKIGAILKHNPDTLEAIVRISPRFEKLRNPILRKLMAGRTSIAMASNIGGCTVDDFLNALLPYGFELDSTTATVAEQQPQVLPDFMKSLDREKLIELDVRPVIDKGDDPLSLIMNKVKQLRQGEVLQIVNSFEPIPLIQLLSKQGFESYAEMVDDNLVNTYFFKNSGSAIPKMEVEASDTADWESVLNSFADRLVSVDVRHLEMPLPMHTILENLETLPDDKALFVYHKRIPVFLLPELEDRGFTYRVKENGEGDVNLLIYKG